jgi:hypothetical protein
VINTSTDPPGAGLEADERAFLHVQAISKMRRGIVVAVLATVATVGLGVTPAQAEPFHYSKMNKGWRPWPSATSPNGPQYWPAPKGAKVSMKCWTTGALQDGTRKWFKIRVESHPFTVGYVPANSVSNQWRTSPRC